MICIYIAAMLLLTSCSANTEKGDSVESSLSMDVVTEDYTANAATIEAKREEMLAIADRVGDFWFSKDVLLQMSDPHAYWLMNRMMQMVALVQTADDGWAWMLAMNESVEEYNNRLGRKIGSVNAACNAIEELIANYHMGSQPELSTARYVESVLEYYRVMNTYYTLIEGFVGDYMPPSEQDLRQQSLYYQEFKAWFDINSAANDLMCRYTYGAAFYSELSMDLNMIFESWVHNRLAELDIEQNIYWNFDLKPYKSRAKRVSSKKFAGLLGYFNTRTKETIVEEIALSWVIKDYDHFYEFIDERFDFDEIAETLRCYETALANWREVRAQIANALHVERQESYREITKQMHARFYNDLMELKEIRY